MMEYPSLYSTKRSGNATAFVNGRVYTVDDARAWAEGFIVDADGTFEVIGSNAEIQKIANRRMLVQYQLRGQFVMPGIHDARTRLMAAGR
jgi:predicted amidohydrolase YtcJ